MWSNPTWPSVPDFVAGAMNSRPVVNLQTPSSWPPRPALTGINHTCLAVVSCQKFTLDLGPITQTPCPRTNRDSHDLSEAVIFDGDVGDAGCDCLKLGMYFVKCSVTSPSQSENVISGDVSVTVMSNLPKPFVYYWKWFILWFILSMM